MNKYVFSTLGRFSLISLMSLALFTACSGGGDDGLKEVSVESALPQDAAFVAVIDYSYGEQVDNFQDLVDQFPDSGFTELFLQEYNKEMVSENMYWENTISPLFGEPWAFGIAVNFPEGIAGMDELADAVDEGDISFVISVEFSDTELAEEVIETLAEEELVGEEKNGVIYYVEEDDAYVARYGNIFVGSNTKNGLDDAIDRMNEESGLDRDENFQAELTALHDSYLSYMYMDTTVFGGLFQSFYGQMGLDAGIFADYFDVMGETFMVVYADEGGIGGRSTVKMLGDERDLESILPGLDHELSLVNKVNGVGMMMYAEQAGLGTMMGGMVDYYATLFGYGAYPDDDYSYEDAIYEENFDEALVQPTDAEVPFELFDNKILRTSVLEIENDELEFNDYKGSSEVVLNKPYLQERASLWEEILVGLSELSNADVDALVEILDSPYAMSFADNGGFLPTLSLYLEIDDSLTEEAKLLAAALDAWVNELMSQLDGELNDYGVLFTDIIKKDVVLVNGGGVHRLYVDWSAVPEDILSVSPFPGLKIEDIVIEFYYGLTGDNVLVLAFEPDFSGNYVKNVLADNEKYQEAIAQVEDSYGYMVSYIDVRAFVGLLDRYVDFARATKSISSTEVAEYDKVMAWVTVFKYFVASGKIDGDIMRSDFYVGIGGE